MTNIEKTLKEFEENFKKEDGSFDTFIFLGSPPSVMEVNSPEYFLRVKQFISQSLTQTRKDTLEEFEGKMPKVVHSREELRELNKHLDSRTREATYHFSEGYVQCLTEIKSLLAELKDK